MGRRRHLLGISLSGPFGDTLVPARLFEEVTDRMKQLPVSKRKTIGSLFSTFLLGGGGGRGLGELDNATAFRITQNKVFISASQDVTSEKKSGC